ncbi:hypothetical protein ACL02O_29125 [Micromonospora sp. MS34]|uniref:hypothetical protein n=1 Tax=Micromonospora sp. MS34 TaxID=3385971 RepID=UPI0039A31EAF
MDLPAVIGDVVVKFWSGNTSHDAKFGGAGVAYTYAFSLPTGANIYELADRLLDSGVARAASIPPSRQVRISRRWQSALRARQLSEAISNLSSVIKGEMTWRAWATKNPRAAAYAFRRRILRFDALGRGRTVKSSEKTQRALEQLREITSKVDDKVVDHTKVVGALAAVDDQLLSPTYLTRSPFIRLELQSLSAESGLLGDGEILPTLLLHRSGVALLTFHAVLGRNRTTDELIEASSGKQMKFDSCTFDGAVVGAGPLFEYTPKGDEWLTTEPDGELGRRFEWQDDQFGIEDVFFVYQDRIRGLVSLKREQVQDYFCYASLFVDDLDCCGSKRRWIRRHSRELAGLMMRHPPYAELREAVVTEAVKGDRGLHDDESRFFTGGNALLISWDFDGGELSPSFVSIANTVAIIENAALQYWQMYVLDYELQLDARSHRRLMATQQMLAQGIEEFRSNAVVYGSANDIIASILAQLRVPELYQRLLDRLSATQQLLDSRRVQESVRRNYLIAGIGSVATVFLGIPAIRDSLGVIAQWNSPRYLEPIFGPLTSWAKSGVSAVLSVYAAVLLLVLAVLALGFLFRRPATRGRKNRKVGIEWTPMSPEWQLSRVRHVGGRPEQEGEATKDW